MSEKTFAFVFFFLAMILTACTSIPSMANTATPAIASLVGSQWNLTSLNGSEPIAGTTITLNFEEDRIAGSAGCNNYGGSFILDASSAIAFGDLFQTEMACLEPAGVQEQETAYLTALSQVAGFNLVENQLELTNTAGETILVFTRQ